jgi:hypothetical protein
MDMDVQQVTAIEAIGQDFTDACDQAATALADLGEVLTRLGATAAQTLAKVTRQALTLEGGPP